MIKELLRSKPHDAKKIVTYGCICKYCKGSGNAHPISDPFFANVNVKPIRCPCCGGSGFIPKD